MDGKLKPNKLKLDKKKKTKRPTRLTEAPDLGQVQKCGGVEKCSARSHPLPSPSTINQCRIYKNAAVRTVKIS